MSETPVASAAKTSVAKAAAKTADHLNTVLPTVVETTDVALELPTKVVVNQRLVFIVGVVGGAALGAGAVYAINKWRERSAKKKIEAAVEEAVVEIKK